MERGGLVAMLKSDMLFEATIRCLSAEVLLAAVDRACEGEAKVVPSSVLV